MIRTSSPHVPVGILVEADLIRRFPDRRDEVVTYAIAKREEELIGLHETRKQLSWHPIQLFKLLLIVGVTTFSIIWSVSQVSAFGHWYVTARTTAVPISIPIIGTTSINIGQYLPASKEIESLQQLPTITLQDSLIWTGVVMGVVLLERVAIILFAWKKIKKLGNGERRVKEEIEQLETLRA
jgi:hypothetical protein